MSIKQASGRTVVGAGGRALAELPGRCVGPENGGLFWGRTFYLVGNSARDPGVAAQKGRMPMSSACERRKVESRPNGLGGRHRFLMFFRRGTAESMA